MKSKMATKAEQIRNRDDNCETNQISNSRSLKITQPKYWKTHTHTHTKHKQFKDKGKKSSVFSFSFSHVVLKKQNKH